MHTVNVKSYGTYKLSDSEFKTLRIGRSELKMRENKALYSITIYIIITHHKTTGYIYKK